VARAAAASQLNVDPLAGGRTSIRKRYEPMESPEEPRARALFHYIRMLGESADKTTHANDRTPYTKHLAQAARLVAELRCRDFAALRERVAAERHSYGWGYLSGPEGVAAEKAWHAFVTLVETEQ
jgi:hypothetical protein